MEGPHRHARLAESPEADRWLPAEGSPRAVALVLHGLNLRPARMEPLCRTLAGLGVDCRLTVFAGHDGAPGPWPRLGRQTLLADASRGWEEASRRARERGVPVVLAAFSLGAVVGSDLLHARPDVDFAALALFAPAFTPRAAARLLRLLSPLPSLVLPSASPREYRANRGTSVAAYGALFDSIAAVRAAGFARAHLPAAVFVDPHDELVSVPGLRRLLAAHRLDRWRLVEVSTAGSPRPRTAHHLVLGPDEVGGSEWSRIEAELRRLLDGLG